MNAGTASTGHDAGTAVRPGGDRGRATAWTSAAHRRRWALRGAASASRAGAVRPGRAAARQGGTRACLRRCGRASWRGHSATPEGRGAIGFTAPVGRAVPAGQLLVLRTTAVAVPVATTSPDSSTNSPARKPTPDARRTIHPRPTRRPGTRGSEELHLQIGRGRELARAQRRDQRRPERVVQHGREEPALHDANRIQELLGRREGDLDGAFVGVDGHQLPTEHQAAGGGSAQPSITSQNGPLATCVPS